MKQLLLILITSFTVSSVAADTVLNCGRLIDVKNKKILKKVSIVVKDNLIKEVKKRYSKGSKVIDLRKKTCLPGLIDLHVHFEQDFPEMIGFHHPDEARAVFETLDFPEKTLMAGFTTVRDLASIRNIPAQMKYAIATKKIMGPRIINVGHPISAPGGHGDFFSKLSTKGNSKAKKHYKNYYGFRFIKKRSDVRPWFQYYFVKRPKWYKSFKSVGKKEDLVPDAIKIMATGGVVSDNPESHKQQIKTDTIQEIVKEAKKQSLAFKKSISVTAHAHGLEGIAAAVFSGANSVEHATELFVDISKEDQNNQKRKDLRAKVHNTMREKEIYMVPTLSAAERVVNLAKKGKLPPHISEKAIRVGEKMEINFSKAVAAKVPIAFGSDTGITPHGDNWKEFLLMVKHSDMTPLEAIQSATVNASKALGLSDEIGSIEKGMQADIIAVEGAPDKKMESIQNVRFVMREGVIYKNLR